MLPLQLKGLVLFGQKMVLVAFHKYKQNLNSIIDPRDGIYTYRDPVSNDILLESIEDGKSQVFVKAKDLVTY